MEEGAPICAWHQFVGYAGYTQLFLVYEPCRSSVSSHTYLHSFDQAGTFPGTPIIAEVSTIETLLGPITDRIQPSPDGGSCRKVSFQVVGPLGGSRNILARPFMHDAAWLPD